jgi:plasmid stability protein
MSSLNTMKTIMAQLTVRKVSDDVVRALRLRAAKHGRSAEAEHRVILAEALRAADDSEFWTRADALRARSRRQRSESGELQRQMRDER